MREAGSITGPSATFKGLRGQSREPRAGKQMETAKREKEQRDVLGQRTHGRWDQEQ